MDAFAPYEEAEQRQTQAVRRDAATRARLATAITSLMHSVEGRQFLRFLLRLCRCFEAADPALLHEPGGTHRLVFNEGRRYAGMSLLALIQAADPGHLPCLLQTKEDDDAS